VLRPNWLSAAISRVAAFAVLGLSVPGSSGQSGPEFEVASVKPHTVSEGPAHVSIARDPGQLTYTNITVRGLIREAYGLRIYPPLHGPDALSTDRYDVIAKMSPGLFEVALEPAFGSTGAAEAISLRIEVAVPGVAHEGREHVRRQRTLVR
jgi:hypothetical protein